jgi:hypothetical protein
MNIVSEVALVALEVSVITPLQIHKRRKTSIICLFTCRLLVVVAVTVQLYLFHKDSSSPQKNDFALGYWRSTIGNQVVQCLAIVTTTLPYAKLFMESFESGLMGVEKVARKEGQSTVGSGKGYELIDVSRSSEPSQHGINTTKTYTVESAPKM